MRLQLHLTRRQLLRWSRAGVFACTGLSVLLPACDWDGNFTILGYTSKPNYDPKYKTVRVPTFANKTYRRNLEFDLTLAVINQIEQITPMKVVTSGQADTELIGTITLVNKSILNMNQLGEVREGEFDMTIELTWRDLHTGEILTKPGKRPVDPSPFGPTPPPIASMDAPGQRSPILSAPLPPTEPTAAQPPAPVGSDVAQVNPTAPVIDPLSHGTVITPGKPPIGPLKITVAGNFIPEVGQSTQTGYQQAINKLAVQIVSAMECPWPNR
jgi:hypothetical protein